MALRKDEIFGILKNFKELNGTNMLRLKLTIFFYCTTNN